MSSGLGTDQITNFEVKVRMLRASYATLVNEKQPDQSPFRPGMSATVDIRTRQVADVATVPIQAVTTRTTSELDGTAEEAPKREKKAKEEADGEEESVDAPEVKEDAVEVVFVLENGKAVAKRVVTGIQDNEYIEIISGVDAGTKVITAPYRAISKKLVSGDPVEAVSKEELYSAKEGEAAE
jgi:HlyD family secretion protein